MSSILGGGNNQLVKPQAAKNLTDFDRRVHESLTKLLWLPTEFKTYIAEYSALLGFPVPVSQIVGFNLTTHAAKASKQGAAQAIANATETVVTLDTSDYDKPDGGMVVLADERIKVLVAGRYYVGASVAYAGNIVGVRDALLYKNGATLISFGRTNAAAGARSSFVLAAVVVDLVVDDNVEVRAFQDSGGSLDVTAGVATTYLSVARVN